MREMQSAQQRRNLVKVLNDKTIAMKLGNTLPYQSSNLFELWKYYNSWFHKLDTYILIEND